MTDKPSLAKHVAFDASPARVARLWDAVSARVDGGALRRRRAWRYAGAGVAAAALAGAVALGLSRFDDASPFGGSSWDAAALETASDSLVVDLKDGSRIELDARTRIEVEKSTDASLGLRLRRGRVECDLVPRSGRRFTLHAAGVDVHVTGTRFSVEIGPDNGWVDVAVERGSVEVFSPLGAEPQRRLAAGERWSIDLRPGKRGEPAGPVRSGAASPPEPSAALPEPETPKAAGSASSKPQGARELLDAGNMARRAGDHRGAADAYELLLARHPSDPRAGLAAFELGRLRMGTLGDVPGAVQAFRRAIALAPGAGFREDAMARLVSAHAELGQHAECRSARDTYLREYPRGVHAAAVSQRCGAR